MTPTLSDKVQKQHAYCNIPNWWEHGYTGKGIGIWNMEGFTDHGTRTRRTIEYVAPDATIISGHAGTGISADGVLKDPKVYIQEKKDGEKTPVPLEEFLQKYDIRVVTASLEPAPFLHPGYKVAKGWQELIEKYDLCVFNSSGNDFKRDKTLDNQDVGIWYIGALGFDAKGGISRHGYSNGGEGLDFADFTADWRGTSFSSPYLAGKCALVRQRYPHFNRFEVYEYMKEHCLDLGDAGEDTLFGHGLVILPDDFKEEEDVEITKTKILVNGEVKEVKRILYKNENFIRLRDYQDVLGICEVDYDKEKNLPIVRKG